jgi:hypothetical protein
MSFIQITIDHHVLTYEMAQTPLADVWLDFMLSLSPDRYVWKDLQEIHILTVNGQKLSQQRLDHLTEEMQLIYRDFNDLHLQFHKNTEKEHDIRWSEINNLIHDLERPVSKDSTIAKFYVGYDPERTDLPLITERLRPNWAHSRKSGDLCLGYHTIGKSLWHCCRDHDPEVIKQGYVSPQIKIGPEVLLFFGNISQLSNSKKHSMIEKFLSDYNFLDLVDLNDPANQYHGEPLLARLLDPMEKVLEWLTPNSEIQQLQILPFR